MPRFYFDTRDGVMVRDDLGIECENAQEVRLHALAGLADFAKDAIPS